MGFHGAVYWKHWLNGKETVGTTSALITANANAKAIFLKADPGNAGTVYVTKGATADANDFPLAAGETLPSWIPVNDASEVAIYGSQASQVVHWIVVY